METQQNYSDFGAQLTLKVDSGLSLGSIFKLRSNRNIIGRSVDVDIPVDDGRVSRLHTAIVEDQGNFLISDLGSTNGTYLNGIFLKGVERLKVGDQIRVGATVFLVESLENSKLSASRIWREPTRNLKFSMKPVSKLQVEEKHQEKFDEMTEKLAAFLFLLESQLRVRPSPQVILLITSISLILLAIFARLL